MPTAKLLPIYPEIKNLIEAKREHEELLNCISNENDFY
jgi:hypothetical protein